MTVPLFTNWLTGQPIDLNTAANQSSVTLSPTGLGYTTGAGGTVTQLTNKSTAVTLNTACGQITMNNATLNAGVLVAFQLNNTVYNAATDVIYAHHATGGTTLAYRVEIFAGGANAVDIAVTNTTGNPLSEAIVINFVVIKGASS